MWVFRAVGKGGGPSPMSDLDVRIGDTEHGVRSTPCLVRTLSLIYDRKTPIVDIDER